MGILKNWLERIEKIERHTGATSEFCGCGNETGNVVFVIDEGQPIPDRPQPKNCGVCNRPQQLATFIVEVCD